MVERYNTEEADLFITRNVGIYDVFTEFDLATLDETSPAATNLDGALIQQFEQQNADLRVSQLVPTGGTVRLDFLNREVYLALGRHWAAVGIVDPRKRQTDELRGKWRFSGE